MHNEHVVQYEDLLYLWDIVKTQLCTDDSGWVPIERWEKTKEMNKTLFDMYVQTMRKELSPVAASKKWPFPPKSSSWIRLPTIQRFFFPVQSIPTPRAFLPRIAPLPGQFCLLVPFRASHVDSSAASP